MEKRTTSKHETSFDCIFESVNNSIRLHKRDAKRVYRPVKHRSALAPTTIINYGSIMRSLLIDWLSVSDCDIKAECLFPKYSFSKYQTKRSDKFGYF